MAVTRIKNNQITDLTVNAAAKLQDFSITSGKIANNLTYGSDLTVAGNLTVQGNVTAIDTTDLVVEDPLILLAKDQTGSPSLDIGFIGKRGTEDNIAWVWDESADEFAAVFTTSEVTNTVIAINSYASIHALDITAANLDISGNIEFSGNIVGNFVVTGNVDAGNLNATNKITGAAGEFSGNIVAANINANTNVTATTISASGNITGNNVISNNDVTTATVSASGNILAANINANTNVTSTTVSASGNITGNNLISNNDVTTATVTASGNILAANINANTNVTSTTVSASGNVIGNNLVSNNDVTTATVTASGNILAANVNANASVTATDVDASANVNAGTAVNANLIAGTSLQIVSTGDLDLEPTGNITVSGVLIRDVGDPLLAQDAATKQYVDDAVSSGIHIHPPVLVETPVALPAATYAQGGNVFTVTDTVAGNTVVFSTAANLQVNDQLWFDNSFNGVVGNLAYFVVSAPNTSAAVLSTTYNGVPVANIANASGLTESVRVNSGIGANLTANVNGALTVDGVSVSNGDRVLVYQQALGYENGVYDVTDAGNVSAPWILTRSSDTDTYEPQTSTGLDQGSYFYVQSGDTGAGESYVKTAPPGPFIIGLANIVFTQFSASQVYSANTQAGLSLTGTVFAAKVDNDTTAFDGGGNIKVKDGANLTTPNIGNATGNSLTLSGNGLLSATTVQASGNVLAGNVNSNAAVTGVTVSASGNITGNNVISNNDVTTATVTASGNILAANVNANTTITAVTVSATGNLVGNNAVIGNNVNSINLTATGTVTTPNVTSAGGLLITTAANGNITLDPNGSGLIVLEDETANRMLFTGVNKEIATDGNATFDGANLVITGSLTVDNVVINGADITSTSSELTINDAGADVNFRVAGDTIANLLVVDAGSDTVLIGTGTPTTNAALKIGTSNSILIPVGNTQQRPDVPVTGMVRFNTTIDNLEFYDADSWTPAGSLFTVITADEFTGDGSTVVFTLSEDSTTAGTIVSINGVVQQPITAYGVAGNVLTFTEAPESTDVIDARILTTTTTVTALQNTSGNAIFEALDTSAAFSMTGNLLPAANVTYDIGSPTAYWNNAYFSGNTIFLGPLQLKAVSATEFGVFQADGTTTADLDVGNIDVGAIIQGNTVIGIAGIDGNAFVTIDGTANVLTVSAAGANVTGTLGVSGNITGNYVLGNGSQLTGIDATSIQSGTSNVRVVSTNGNVDVNVNGNPIVTFYAGGINNRQANGVGNIGTATSTFNTIFAKATSAQYADLAEMYRADAAYEPGTVVSFGGDLEVTVSTMDSDARVAGVVSTNPSYIMNSALAGDHVTAVALTGRVPTRVTGAVRKGDMMVSAGDGTARAERDPAVGTVIGKALEDHEGGSGVIEVVVGRL